MSNDREYQTEISEAFRAILADNIYPEPEGRPVETGNFYDDRRAIKAWTNAVGPYALQAQVTDLQIGDVIVYAEEESRSSRGEKYYSSVVDETKSAYDFVLSVSDSWKSANLAVVVAKTPKSVEVQPLSRPGYSGTLANPELLGKTDWEPGDYSYRFGRSSHRVIIVLGQYSDVVNAIKTSKHFSTLKAVCTDLQRSITASENARDNKQAKVEALAAPLVAAKNLVNEALGVKYLDVSNTEVYHSNYALPDPMLEVRSYGDLKSVPAHSEVLRDMLAGRVALGKTTQGQADEALAILEAFIERGEDGNWTSVASRIGANALSERVAA